MTAEDIDKPFLHVTGDMQDQAGRGGDLRRLDAATCKIAGIACEGPRNLVLITNIIRVDDPGGPTRTGRDGLNGVNYDRSVSRYGFPSATDTRLLVQSAATTALAWPAWELHGRAMASREQGPTEPGVVPTAACSRGPGSSGLGGAVCGYSPENGSICAA